MFALIMGMLIPLPCFIVSTGLTFFYPDICWLPRIGGALVGIAVFMQGYMEAKPDKFSRMLSYGITIHQRLMHVSYSLALVGTFFGLLETCFFRLQRTQDVSKLHIVCC